MNLIQSNNKKIYDLSENKSFEEYLKEYKSKKNIWEKSNYHKEIQLIQDFKFNTASNKIRLSDDWNFLMVSGVYGP